MSLSGVTVEDAIVKKYNEMRFKKLTGGLILHIIDEKIQIEKEIEGSFETIVSSLPKDDPRYVLFDVPMQNRANIAVFKTVFLFWLPMESPVRQRMLYASSKSVIIREFRGISTHFQEDEKENLTLNKVISKVNRTQGINTNAL